MMSSNHQGVMSDNVTMAKDYGHADLNAINSSQKDWLESSISMEIDRRVEQWSQQTQQIPQPMLEKSVYQHSYQQYVYNNGMDLAPSSKATNCQTHLSTSPVYTSIQFQNHQVPLPQQPVSMTHLISKPYPAPNPSFARPQAHISLVPNSNGGFRAVVKRKRKRTMFTTEQVEYLETIFSTKPYVTREERQVLVKKLQVSDSAVKVWFQNRRIRGKKENEQTLSECYRGSSPNELSFYSSPNSVQDLHSNTNNSNYIKIDDDDAMRETVTVNTVNDHSSSSEGSLNDPPCSSYLDYLEAELDQKADQLGFITLDDKFLGEIVKAINIVFTGHLNFNAPPNEAKYEVPQEEIVDRRSCKKEEYATEVMTNDSFASNEGKSEEEESADSEVSSNAGSIYEPISPAASESAGEETPTCWRPFAPEHSLQQLFDLHFC